MEKLKKLLQNIGASEELAEGVSEEFERYAARLKKAYNSEFQNRLAKAKQICVEEVEKEKAAISRKVSVFLESKAKAIDEAAERQRKLEESEATLALRSIRELVSSTGSNTAGGDTRESQAAHKTVARLEKALASLKEERDGAIHKANRAHKIAENSLRRNHDLESVLRSKGVDLSEGGMPDDVKAMFAKKNGKKKESDSDDEKKDDDDSDSDDKPFESKKPNNRKRLDESRRASASPKSTRRTLAESQARTKHIRRQQSADNTIAGIADVIYEDV